MITVRLSGGLGNQMFQYAFGRARADETGDELVLVPTLAKTHETPRPFLLDHFNIRARIASDTDFEHSFLKRLRDAFRKQAAKSILSGNWQSENYFKKDAEAIRRDFILKTPLLPLALEIKKKMLESNSVSIHIRRGDYVTNQKFNKKHGVLPVEYYTKAIELISKKVPQPKFFIFSDDIEWVKKIPLPNATFVSGGTFSAPEELTLMSSCTHHIIANSTFSWWGAWLNPAKDKMVIAPAKWYAQSNIDTTDLVPDEWIQI